MSTLNGTVTSGTAEMPSLGETKEECWSRFHREVKDKVKDTENVLAIQPVGEPLYDEKRDRYIFAIRTIWIDKK